MNFNLSNYTKSDKLIVSVLAELATCDKIKYPIKDLHPEYIEFYPMDDITFQLNFTRNKTFNSGEPVRVINRKTKRIYVRDELDLRLKDTKALVKNYKKLYQKKVNEICEFLIPQLANKIIVTNFNSPYWINYFNKIEISSKTNIFLHQPKEISFREGDLFITFEGYTFYPSQFELAYVTLPLFYNLREVLKTHELEFILLTKIIEIEELLRKIFIRQN